MPPPHYTASAAGWQRGCLPAWVATRHPVQSHCRGEQAATTGSNRGDWQVLRGGCLFQRNDVDLFFPETKVGSPLSVHAGTGSTPMRAHSSTSVLCCQVRGSPRQGCYRVTGLMQTGPVCVAAGLGMSLNPQKLSEHVIVPGVERSSCWWPGIMEANCYTVPFPLPAWDGCGRLVRGAETAQAPVLGGRSGPEDGAGSLFTPEARPGPNPASRRSEDPCRR
jgi:hypothetical protein